MTMEVIFQLRHHRRHRQVRRLIFQDSHRRSAHRPMYLEAKIF